MERLMDIKHFYVAELALYGNNYAVFSIVQIL